MRMFRFRFDYSAGPLKPARNDTLSASGGRGGGVLDITLCLVIGVLFREKKNTLNISRTKETDQRQSCIFTQLFRTVLACYDNLAQNYIPCSGQRDKKKNIPCPAASPHISHVREYRNPKNFVHHGCCISHSSM